MGSNHTSIDATPAEPSKDAVALTDRLLWQDKLPLALALMAQSYVVFIWYLRSTHGIHPYVDFIVALAAGIALDWLTVSTVMGRREGRTSIWSWLTSFGAFIGSAMIAYDTYATQWWPLDGKALLHVIYSLVVLLYSLHLAAPKQRTEVVAQPARDGERKAGSETLPVLSASGEEPQTPFQLTEAQLKVSTTVEAPFSCPSCGGPLESIGELGAAKRWGHCRHCKGKTTVPLTHSVGHTSNGASAE